MSAATAKAGKLRRAAVGAGKEVGDALGTAMHKTSPSTAAVWLLAFVTLGAMVLLGLQLNAVAGPAEEWRQQLQQHVAQPSHHGTATRLAVLESNLARMAADLDEVKRDVKILLERGR